MTNEIERDWSKRRDSSIRESNSRQTTAKAQRALVRVCLVILEPRTSPYRVTFFRPRCHRARNV